MWMEGRNSIELTVLRTYSLTTDMHAALLAPYGFISHRHSRGHNARPHHGHPQYRKHIIQERQQQRQHERATVILSNNKYSTSATATVTLAADDVPSPYNATPPLSSSSSGQLHERQSSPPSSLLPTQYTTITLSNYSPILDPPSLATPATDPTTTTTTPTSRRHKPTTSTASARTSTPRRKPASTKTQPTQARRPLTRTTPSRTSNKTPPLSSQSPTCVILPAEPPPLPRISNVVHICIARSPVSDANATPPPPITFTSTVLFSNGLDPLTRPTPTTRRDDNWNTWSRDANFNNNNNGSPPPATIITVTDYNCQLTLPRFSRPASTRSFTSGPTLSPSNGLNVDNSTLSPIGPNAADPTTGNGDIDISDGKVDDETAFFATPGGKGTIAGISIASAILLLSFVLFFVWRKKKNGNGTTVAGHGDNRGSASTFGDSSGDPGGANGGSSVGNGDQAVPSATLDPHIVSNMHPEMSQLSGTGPPGSFFVQRRSQPSSLRGTDTPPRATYTNQLDAATAARAISPLAMLQARPQAFIPPPPPPHRTASRAGYSNEGANSDEDKPSSGSSHGHDPFKDPSSTGHTSIRHEIGTVAPFSDKHQRRRSGYTSDTYRKRRSRPVSELRQAIPVYLDALPF